MPPTTATDHRDLAGALRHLVLAQLEQFADRYAPDWALPAMLGGHPVGADVRADLAFTLGWLHASGADAVAGTSIAGRPVVEAVSTVLGGLDPDATHTFSSYRVAETVARFGPWDDNPLTRTWSDGQRAGLAVATDSADWLGALDRGELPANYAAVLARCERARAELGLPVASGAVESLVARTAALLAANPLGFLDDDPARTARYDIYSLDLYLFTEPFADDLPTWESGLASVARLIARTAGRSGAAVPWGRSTGVLGLCHTVELGALLTARRLGDPELRSRLLALAAVAADRLPAWFHEGLCTAHQGRAMYRYRGPARRLQLTFDALGKLAWAAWLLDRAAAGDDAPGGEPGSGPFVDDDTWTPFESDRPVGVWTHRSRQLAFSLPIVGTAWSDYLPGPRAPGAFETPVDRPLAVGTPTVRADGATFAGGGIPRTVDHDARARQLHVGWAGFPTLGGLDGAASTLPGARDATFTVEGRTLHVDEALTFDEAPDALVIAVAEAENQPLVVDADGAHPHTITTVDTAGIAEWRSFWGELPRVHQIELAPAPEVRLRWSVTPALRVATDDVHHWYHRSLYDPMAPWVVDRHVHPHRLGGRRGAHELTTMDVYHFHWPEWIFDTDVDAAESFLDRLDQAEIPLVWTQHNLLPHREGDFAPLYDLFAARATAVIHHSEWGRARVHATRPYRPGMIEAVIPHGHWAARLPERTPADRAAAEAELGLAPCTLRIGVVGAPRPGKDTAGFVRAFAACGREDLQLAVFSLDPDDAEESADADEDAASDGLARSDELALLVAGDDRIHAEPYEFVDLDVYARRLAAIDVLAFPFVPDTPMLTSGVFADAIGAGLPALVTGWGFLVETLGDAGIPMGDTPDEWTAALDALDRAAVTAAARASAALRPTYDWPRIAELTRDLFARLPLRV